MTDPVHVVAVLNSATNHEALYLGGDLRDSDSTLYMADVAKVTEGLVIQFSHVMVDFPADMAFPERFEELMKYIVEDASGRHCKPFRDSLEGEPDFNSPRTGKIQTVSERPSEKATGDEVPINTNDYYTVNEPVRIEPRLIKRIGIRELGLPSLVIPGQIWRSEKHGTISCILPHPTDATKVEINTRRLDVIGVGEMSWMPNDWREALWQYVHEYPHSGCRFGPFLAISEESRHRFLRKLGRELVESDEIGCRHIAHSIGQFAALEFETVSSVS